MPSRSHTTACLAVLFFAGAVLLSSCSSYQAEEAPTTSYTGAPQYYTPTVLSDTSLVAVGDSVALSVWGYTEFGTHAIVKANGMITTPLLGELVAAGLTKAELARALRGRLAEYIPGEIKISLDISNPISHITVLGAVVRQGSFPAITDIPLLEVISNAGGWTVDADLRYLKITRQSSREEGKRFVEIDLELYLESANVRALPNVRPGDVVIVPAKENYVRGVGEFFRDALLIFGLIGLMK